MCELCNVQDAPIKAIYLMFDKFNKMLTDFRHLFTNWFIREFSLHMHSDFHAICNMLLHYVVKFENLKMLLNFHVEW